MLAYTKVMDMFNILVGKLASKLTSEGNDAILEHIGSTESYMVPERTNSRIT
jgi:hypothetical protein